MSEAYDAAADHRRQLRRRRRPARRRGAGRRVRGPRRHPRRREQPGQAHPRRAQGVVPVDGPRGRGVRAWSTAGSPRSGCPDGWRLLVDRRVRRDRRGDHRLRRTPLQAAAARARCSPSCPAPRWSTAWPADARELDRRDGRAAALRPQRRTWPSRRTRPSHRRRAIDSRDDTARKGPPCRSRCADFALTCAQPSLAFPLADERSTYSDIVGRRSPDRQTRDLPPRAGGAQIAERPPASRRPNLLQRGYRSWRARRAPDVRPPRDRDRAARPQVERPASRSCGSCRRAPSSPPASC